MPKVRPQGNGWLRSSGVNGLIAIDESTTIKNHKAKRTKSLLKIAAKFKYKRLLTGSPVTKSPMDLFAQFQFLDPTILATTLSMLSRALRRSTKAQHGCA